MKRLLNCRSNLIFNSILLAINQIKSEIASQTFYITLDSKSKDDYFKLENLLSTVSSEPYIAHYPILSSDTMVYIYTSGTTGLPK